MRFVSSGVDIPIELVDAQERGEVVFLCGAGVSRRVGLPSFKELVEQIYAALTESIADNPLEAEAFRRGEYDRVLGLLVRRVGERDARRAPLMRRRLRDTVRESLKCTACHFPDHAALLQLSRNVRLETCLVTTNFDTLFEVAAKRDLGATIDSQAGQALAGPQSERFAGVLHLHGRLANDELKLEDTDLVLTSAEFGDAYLRAGWAARWLYDLIRTTTVVLVGYAADDPPMRYLLETLDADRSRFRDLKPIYAFASALEGEDESVTEQWSAKGVEPLIYRETEGGGHDALYLTLREWARLSDDPRAWREERVRTHFAHTIERGRIDEAIALLRSIDGTRLLGESNPSAEWAGPLISQDAFRDERPSPGSWIVKRLADPLMIDAWANRPELGPWARETVRRAVDNDASLPEAVRTAWRAILRASQSPSQDEDARTYLALDRLRVGDRRAAVLDQIVEALRPRLGVGRSLRYFGADEQPADIKDYTLSQLVWVRYEPTGINGLGDISASIHGDPDVAVPFLARCAAAMEQALEDAWDFGVAGGEFDRASFEVHSVSPHPQDEHSGGFYPIVRHFVDVAESIAGMRPDVIGKYFAQWRDSPFVLLKRVALHLATLPAISASEAAALLLDIGDADFWDGDMRRESIRLMAARWSQFSMDEIDRIEMRIASGPPASLYPEEWSPEEREEYSDHQIYIRFGRLSSSGVTLRPSARKVMRTIEGKRQFLREPVVERAEFQSWGESSAGDRGDPSAVADVPVEKLIDAARALEEKDSWGQGQLTRLVVNENPRRFLAALDAQIAAGRTEPRAWSTFLGQVGQGEDDRLALATARTLLRMSDDDLKAIDQQAAWWLEQQYHRRSRAKAKWPKALNEVRERLINVVYTADGPAEHVAPRDQDRALLATAAGALATITLGEVLRKKRVNTPAKKAALDALQRLTDCRGENGTIALMACARQLSRLHYLAPEWCERVVTPRMLPLTPVAAALWRARSSDGHPGLPSLVQLTKDRLMHAILFDCVSDHEERNLFVLLLLSCAWRMRGSVPDQPVMPADVKHVLRRSKPELRRHLLWLLWRWLDAAKDERAEAWRKHYGPLFESVWPLDARLQDGESTRGLIDIAYASGDAFPEAVRAVLPFVTPTDGRRPQSVFRLRKDEDRVVARFPEEVLELLDMVVREPSHVPYELDSVLDEVVAARASLERNPRHRRLRRLIAASRA